MTARRYTKREGPWVESIPLVYRHKLPIGNLEQYWRGLERGIIYATRCVTCGAVYYPPQVNCPSCGNQNMEWVELPREGIVETFTKIYAKPQGYEDFDPYIVAIVSTGEFKIMGWLKTKDEKCVKVGDRVSIKTEKIEKHNKYIIIFELINKVC